MKIQLQRSNMAWSKPVCKASSSKNINDEEVDLTELLKLLHIKASTVRYDESRTRKTNDGHNEINKQNMTDLKSQKTLTSQYDPFEQNTMEKKEDSLHMIQEIQNLHDQDIESQSIYMLHESLQVVSSRTPVWWPANNDQPSIFFDVKEPQPTYVAKCGDLVVAFVQQSEEKRWIMAEVVEFKNGKYEVEDINVHENNRNFILDKKYIKLLPSTKESSTNDPDTFFGSNEFVLAMYPKTTWFFKALVKTPPKTNSDGYEVLFADQFNQYTISMIVPQRFVISL